MIEPTLQWRFEQFDRALQRYIFDLKIDARKVVTVHARLLVAQFMRYTPPNTLAQGRRAIARDLRRVFSPVDTGKWNTWYDADDHLRMAPRGGTNRRSSAAKNSNVFMARGEMKAFHKGRRNQRGRVKATRIDSVVGRSRSEISQKPLVTERDFRSYLREVQRRTGFTKAGFAPGMRAAGGSVPSWISRHGDAAGSSVSNLGDRNNPRLRVINQGPGVVAIEPRALALALRTRTRAMEADIRRIMKGGKSRYFS